MLRWPTAGLRRRLAVWCVSRRFSRFGEPPALAGESRKNAWRSSPPTEVGGSPLRENARLFLRHGNSYGEPRASARGCYRLWPMLRWTTAGLRRRLADCKNRRFLWHRCGSSGARRKPQVDSVSPPAYAGGSWLCKLTLVLAPVRKHHPQDPRPKTHDSRLYTPQADYVSPRTDVRGSVLFSSADFLRAGGSSSQACTTSISTPQTSRLSAMLNTGQSNLS